MLKDLFLDDRFDIQPCPVNLMCFIAFKEPLASMLADVINKRGRLWGRKPPYISPDLFFDVTCEISMKLHKCYHRDYFTVIYTENFEELMLFFNMDMIGKGENIDEFYDLLRRKTNGDEAIFEGGRCRWYRISVRK